MESITQNPSQSESNKRGLVIEHALLATKFSGDSDVEVNRVILARLKEIEEELALSAHQIADVALSYYHAQYK